MSDNKPTNVFQLGAKKPTATPVNGKTMVDQDPSHVPKTFSQELLYTVAPGTEQEVVEGVKAIRSHFLKLLADEGGTLPLLIMVNKCEFPGALDKPTEELLNLRRRFKWTVDAYFGQPNKISKQIKDAADEFFMQVRLLMFSDNTVSGHRLADEGTVVARLIVSAFGVVVVWSISGFPDHSHFIPHFPD